MIRWMERIFKKLFRNNVKLIEESKQIQNIDDRKKDFKISLMEQAHPDQNDGNRI